MRPRRRLSSAIALAVIAVIVATAAPAAGADRWSWPLDSPDVERAFAPPATEYGAGHRGVDLGGEPGQVVTAVAAGTVTFVGQIDGVAMVTVTHGAERSTYQPVDPGVTEGTAVSRGQPIGTLLAGHRGCGANACLHLGRLHGDTYLDPTEPMGGRYRLIDPDGDPPTPPSRGEETLSMPVQGPITSNYGMRVHPVTGVHKLHDGVDIAAPCGTTVHAAAGGTVQFAGAAGGYGLRVEVHGSGGDGVSYSHLAQIRVAAGQLVSVGDVLGTVGTTGLSTGCHLHLSVHAGARTVDPAPLL